MDVSLLKHFVAVARTGNFTRAAQDVHAGQSVVSRSVQRLEQIIGVPLLERDTRNVALTDAGQALLHDFQSILIRMDSAVSTTRRIDKGLSPKMTIAICDSLEGVELVNGISLFREQHMDVRLNFAVIGGRLQIKALQSGEVTVGVMPVMDEDRDGLHWQLLTRPRLGVAVPKSWGYHPSEPIKLSVLQDRPWLVPNPTLAPSIYRDTMAIFEEAGFEPKIAGWIGPAIETRLAVGCGVGATFVRENAQKYHFSGIEVLRVADIEIRSADIAVVWPKQRPSPFVAHFVDCLKQGFAREMG